MFDRPMRKRYLQSCSWRVTGKRYLSLTLRALG